MRTAKEKILWMLYACVLVLLFLLSSTDMIIKERETEVYPISIIIEDAKDDYYVNFKKGMDQAAIEFNVDVSFITLYESGNLEQQKDLIAREQQGGAKALVVSAVKSQMIADIIGESRLNGPLVLYKTNLSGDKINVSISPDYYAMGQLLGEQVKKDQPAHFPVYLFGSQILNEVSSQVYDGISATLEAAGYETILFQKSEEHFFREKIEELIYPGCEDVVIVALDPESLTETAEVFASNSVYASYMGGLYGRGATIPILNNLDREIITGICAIDEFGAGYLCVKKAVEAIQNRGIQETITLDNHYIQKEDIRKPEYEKMLYPIE